MRSLRIVAVLSAVGLAAMVAPTYADTQIQEYGVEDATVTASSVCVHRVNLNHAVCTTAEELKIFVQPKRERTYAVIQMEFEGKRITQMTLVSVIVRSERVKQAWLARINQAGVPADVIPRIEK